MAALFGVPLIFVPNVPVLYSRKHGRKCRAQLFANLQAGLEHLDEAVWFEHLKIDGTKIHQHPLTPQKTPEGIEWIREEPYGNLPPVHLPELMMTEQQTCWIWRMQWTTKHQRGAESSNARTSRGNCDARFNVIPRRVRLGCHGIG